MSSSAQAALRVGAIGLRCSVAIRDTGMTLVCMQKDIYNKSFKTSVSKDGAYTFQYDAVYENQRGYLCFGIAPPP